MTRTALAVVILALAAAGCALGADRNLSGSPELQRLQAPVDVKRFVDRRMGCAHFAGEGSEDRRRAREIATAMRSLRCGRLDRDEQALQARYAASPDVLRVLAETRDWMW